MPQIQRLYLRGKTWWIQVRGGRASTGQTDELLARIWAASYYRREMVLDMLRSDPLLRESIEAYLDDVRQTRKEGLIYAVRAGDDVKIGFTTRSPRKRLKELQIGHGLPLKLVAAQRGTWADEQALHWRLRHARVRGEWFNANDPEVAKWLSNSRRSKIGANEAA